MVRPRVPRDDLVIAAVETLAALNTDHGRNLTRESSADPLADVADAERKRSCGYPISLRLKDLAGVTSTDLGLLNKPDKALDPKPQLKGLFTVMINMSLAIDILGYLPFGRCSTP